MTTIARSVSALLAVALVGASPSPAGAGSADAAYVALAQGYYAQTFKLSPIEATQIGVHDYDDQIGDFSAAGIAQQLAADHDYLAKLDAIDATQLSPSVALDRTLLEYTLRDDLLLNDTLAQWRHNPDDYTEAASGAIFSVMSKDYAPLATRMALCDCARAADPARCCRRAKKNVTTVDAVTQRISAEDAAGSVDFFKSRFRWRLPRFATAHFRRSSKTANAAVIAAMGAYATWIKTLKPSGTFAIGADAYRQRLLYEDASTCRSISILAVGRTSARADARAVHRNGAEDRSESDAAAGLSFDHARPSRARCAALDRPARSRCGCALSSKPSTS